MSYTVTVSGSDAVISSYINPPLQLDPTAHYEIALLNFETFYSIPNIDDSNHHFHYMRDGNPETIVIPHGTYEIGDIHSFLKDKLGLNDDVFFIKPNNNTMKAVIKCPYTVDFTKDNSIGSLLGFANNKIIPAGEVHESDDLVNIFKVSIIRIECSIATGSFIDGKSGHSLYEFFPSVPPGFHISQEPSNPIYLPVIDTECIDEITIRVVDQHGSPINFRNEVITTRVHIRRNGNKF